MNETLLWLLGKADETLPPGAQTEFVWANAPRSWQVFVFLAVAAGLLYGVFWLYRRESANCPGKWRAALAVVRALVIALLLLVLLGPSLAVSVRRTVEPVVLLLLDESLSMSIQDRYLDDEAAQRTANLLATGPAALRENPPTRAAVVDRVLTADDNAWVRSLAVKGQVQVMSFSDRVLLREAIGAKAPPAEDLPPEAEPLPAGEPVPPLRPSGQVTNLARALRDATASVAGTPIAAVVLVSDGQDTVADSPERVAKACAEQGVPIFTVGVGDPAEPRNLRVAELWAPESAFIDDPFEVQGAIESRGLPEAVQVGVELVALPVAPDGTVADAGKSLGRQTVALGPQQPRADVRFEHRPEEPGRYVFALRVAEQPGEVLAQDNEKTASVEVLDRKARVLLIAGGPTWDFRFLRTLLLRDNTIDVSCWLQSMDRDLSQDADEGRQIERLPDTPEGLFEFDAIVLIDPDPDGFTADWIALLERFVSEQAGGLLWMSGPKFSPHFLTFSRTRPVSKLLPVRIDTNRIPELTVRNTREWPLTLEPAGADHPLLRAVPELDRNRRYWESLPGIYWSYPVAGPKPGAQVLLSHSDPNLGRREDGKLVPRPLLVLGQYGLGRVLYFGFRGTWRWRRGGEEHFDRFWVQALRTLAEGRRLRGRRRGRLLTDRDLYTVGDRVIVTAKVFDARFQPLEEPVLRAQLRNRGEPESIELRAVPQQPGSYEGSFIARQVGRNELQLTLDGGEGGSAKLDRAFAIELPNIEFVDPQLNRPLLKLLAERSDGAYFEIDELAELPAQIPEKRETVIVRGKPITLWDSGRLMVLLVALLCLEWALRKRLKLL